MHKSYLLPVLSITAGTLVGCAEVDSEQIRTSGFFVNADVTAAGDVANIQVRLRTGDDFDSDTIVLTSGDQLSANLTGQTIELPRLNAAYSGTFNPAAGGDELTLSLARPNDTDAPNSRVTLPLDFDISAPAFSTSFAAGDSITVVWSPGDRGSTMTLSYSADCTLIEGSNSFHGGRVGRTFNNIPDTGTHTVAVNAILNAFNDQEELVRGIPCPLEITLTRERSGSLDPAFQNGSIDASRTKTVLVTATP